MPVIRSHGRIPSKALFSVIIPSSPRLSRVLGTMSWACGMAGAVLRVCPKVKLIDLQWPDHVARAFPASSRLMLSPVVPVPPPGQRDETEPATAFGPCALGAAVPASLPGTGWRGLIRGCPPPRSLTVLVWQVTASLLELSSVGPI